MGGVCSTHWRDDSGHRVLVGNLKLRVHLEDKVVGGRIILESVLEKKDESLWRAHVNTVISLCFP
jgi:hypothetical protein